MNASDEIVKAIYNIFDSLDERIEYMYGFFKVASGWEYAKIAEGNQTDLKFDMQDVLDTCKRLNANSFFLVHNHPNGDTTPSIIDIIATGKIINISRDNGLKFLDHFIVSSINNGISPNNVRSLYSLVADRWMLDEE